MKYEPIKNVLNKVFATPFLRKIFYKLIDILLLRAWYIHREFKRWLKNAPENPEIYDAGSGLGQHSFFMLNKCKSCRLTAVDINKEQIENTQKFFEKIGFAGRAEFITGDVAEFVRPDSFDFILNVEVIEHIEDDVKALTNFYTSLKKGGMLLLSTPSEYAVDHDHDNEGGFVVDEHVRDGYSPGELSEKLRKAGFEDFEISYIYGKWGSIAWHLSMKYPIIMLNKSFLFFALLPFYYIVAMPFALIFDWFDTLTNNKKGTSLLVKARK